MGRYGTFGGPSALIEAYIDWRDERLALVEAGEIEEADGRADFPEFLYGPIRTALWHGYQRVQPNWRRYARKENMVDFRERRLRGINALTGISRVGESGHYEQMRRTERKPAVLGIDTYGAVYSVTRQMIRNDESGDLLNKNPGDMGYAMGVFVMQAMAALIESNPLTFDGATMANDTRGNHTTNALSEDSLANAIAWVENQTDEDGFPIVVQFATLAVHGPKLELIAKRILNSSIAAVPVGATTQTTTTMYQGTDNPVSALLPADAVVRERFFTDLTDWRLFANPNELPAFCIGFLDGDESPFIGIKEPQVRNALGAGTDPYTYEFDSVDFKMRLDFGVAPLDFRGYYWAEVA